MLPAGSWGQEALVLAAAVAFNPIVNLAAWQEDLASSDVSEIREFQTDKLVANEVGGLYQMLKAQSLANPVTEYKRMG